MIVGGGGVFIIKLVGGDYSHTRVPYSHFRPKNVHPEMSNFQPESTAHTVSPTQAKAIKRIPGQKIKGLGFRGLGSRVYYSESPRRNGQHESPRTRVENIEP